MTYDPLKDAMNLVHLKKGFVKEIDWFKNFELSE
jgi:hypothetical protein